MPPKDQQIQTNRRLHVLHVSVPTSGGVATVATSYVRDQVERGWNVTVVCPSKGDLGYAAREAGAAVRWWRADAYESTLPGAVVRLNRIVKEIEPDVVHLHSGRAGLAGRLVVRNRIPTVFQPHAWSFLAARERRPRCLAALGAVRRALGHGAGLCEHDRAPAGREPEHPRADDGDPERHRPGRVPPRCSPRPDPRAQAAGARRRPDRALRGRAERAEGSAGPAHRLAGGPGPGAGGAADPGRRRPRPPGPGAAGRGGRRRHVRRRPHRRTPLDGGCRRGRGARPVGRGWRWCRWRPWPARAASSPPTSTA